VSKVKLLWTGKARVYFNSWSEGPLFWSVDQGDIGTEVKCAQIMIEGSSGRTVVRAEGKEQPRAWLLLHVVSVYQVGDYLLIQ
jgi:hypothetical protein